MRPIASMDMATAQELWGPETGKAIENFPVSGEQVPAPVVHWLGRIKAAAARVNGELGPVSYTHLTLPTILLV